MTVRDEATQAALDDLFADIIAMVREVHDLPEDIETRGAIAMHMASYMAAYAVSVVIEGDRDHDKLRAARFVASEIEGMVLSGLQMHRCKEAPAGHVH